MNSDILMERGVCPAVLRQPAYLPKVYIGTIYLSKYISNFYLRYQGRNTYKTHLLTSTTRSISFPQTRYITACVFIAITSQSIFVPLANTGWLKALATLHIAFHKYPSSRDSSFTRMSNPGTPAPGVASDDDEADASQRQHVPLVKYGQNIMVCSLQLALRLGYS